MSKKPDAILTADWHIRETTPLCRTDDFLKTQLNKIKQIREIQEKYNNIPILLAGDIFHQWKVFPKLLSTSISWMPDNIFSVPGNHDLPAHSFERLEESAYYTLFCADKIHSCINEGGICAPITLFKKLNFVAYGFPFGSKLSPNKHRNNRNRSVAIVHELTYKSKKPFPGKILESKQIIKKLKGYDLIVIGDNHKPFTRKYKGQLLVNPGSITRQRTSETHKPKVYLWYADTNEVEPVYLEIKKNVISKEHIEEEKERDERIEKFIDMLDEDLDMGLDFKNNMRIFFSENKLGKLTKRKILEAMDD